MDSLLAEISRFGAGNAFSDVILVGSDCECQAHAALLAARSDVLARMLSSSFLEGQRDAEGRRRVILDFPGAVLDRVLRWIYADSLEATLPLEALLPLQVAADFLNIRGLLTKCSERLADKMTCQAFPAAVEMAVAQNAQALQQSLSTFAAKHWDTGKVREAVAPIQVSVLQERLALAERKLKAFRSAEFSAAAARSPVVFWRQSLPLEQQVEMLASAVQQGDPGLLAALWRTFRESSIGCAALDTAWTAEQNRRHYEAKAQEDAESVEAQRARLRAQREGMEAELRALHSEVVGAKAAIAVAS